MQHVNKQCKEQRFGAMMNGGLERKEESVSRVQASGVQQAEALLLSGTALCLAALDNCPAKCPCVAHTFKQKALAST